MKTHNFKTGLFRISDSLEIVLKKVINSLEGGNFDASYNNTRIFEILENKQDEILINNTIEELKKSNETKSRRIELSNDNFLTVSIE